MSGSSNIVSKPKKASAWAVIVLAVLLAVPTVSAVVLFWLAAGNVTHGFWQFALASLPIAAFYALLIDVVSRSKS